MKVLTPVSHISHGNLYFITQLNSNYKGKYYYNACRVPLRVVMDYAHYGNANAKIISERMVNWARSSTSNRPNMIRAGYELNGTVLSGSNYESTVFIAPLVAASVTNNANAQWLTDGWNKIKTMRQGYFEDTYNMLCMLFISGNWWIPL